VPSKGRKLPPPSPDQVRRLLALPAPKFYDQFAILTQWLTPAPIASWPALLRTITSLQVLDVNASVSDIAGYFSEWPDEWGAYAYDVERLLREIGVNDAADALAAAIALYPQRRLPPKHWDRSRLASRLWDRNNNVWQPSTRRFRQAKRRIPGALKRYLLANESMFTAAFAERSAAASARSRQSLLAALALVTPLARVRRGAPREHAALVAVGERITRLLQPTRPDKGLTKGERLFHVLWSVMDAEVQNGGLHQFLSNSSGALGEEAKDHLTTIGAAKARQVLARASVMFSHGVIPKNRRLRNQALSTAEKRADASWKQLAQAEADYAQAAKTDLYPRLLRWVAKHEDEFADR